MSANFNNSVVLITGASQGIGRQTALAFAARGAKLVLAARSVDRLAQVKNEIRQLGSEAICAPTDVSDKTAVQALIDKAMTQFGRLDVLVNNAGIGRVGSIESEAFGEDLNDTLKASLFGMIQVTREVLPIFRKQQSGVIVNMSSVMGRKAFARFGSYDIVMHGVSAFSDALRQELADSNIRVTVIHPGLTATDLLREADVSEIPAAFQYMTPLSSEAVAEAVVKAVRSGARRVVLPRTANMLLLGDALSPWIGDIIAKALTVKSIARLLGMSDGKTYHETILGRPVERGAKA
jgi:NADP-dependent 3-hydroxy acid dehydrogenase YdfG